ncbi:MAG: hypothetical protein V1897_06020, partial [Pseudomonadota bacterium]
LLAIPFYPKRCILCGDQKSLGNSFTGTKASERSSNDEGFSDDFNARWQMLTKYDESTQRAINLLEPFGERAIYELKKTHYATNDPEKLVGIAEKIAEEWKVNPPADTTNTEEQEEPSSEFLDKAIAFLLLIYPFSKLIEFVQDQLHDRLPQSIANISVLIGIIGFLVAIGWLAKVIYTYRLKLSSK